MVRDFTFNLPYRLRLPDGYYYVRLPGKNEVVQLSLKEQIPARYDDRMGIRGLTPDDLKDATLIHLMSLEKEAEDGQRVFEVTPNEIWKRTDIAKINYVVKNGQNSTFKPPVVINAELPNDKLGRFRYTKVTLVVGDGDSLEVAVEAINKLIDFYRLFSHEYWIYRIKKDDIKVYEYESGRQHGYGAFMKRQTDLSGWALEEFKKQIAHDKPPSTYYLLYLDAKNAHDEENYRLAVVYSIMAFESLVKTFFTGYISDCGFSKKCEKRLFEELSLYHLVMKILKFLPDLENEIDYSRNL